MEKYEDIINLPHHQSETRAHMPIRDRAAQFAPFAALTGHDAAIRETARLTEQKPELDESEKTALGEKLKLLQSNTDIRAEAMFTYFVHDEKKSGGALVSHSGFLGKVDTYRRTVILRDGTEFPIDNLYSVDGEMFDDFA